MHYQPSIANAPLSIDNAGTKVILTVYSLKIFWKRLKHLVFLLYFCARETAFRHFIAYWPCMHRYGFYKSTQKACG